MVRTLLALCLLPGALAAQQFVRDGAAFTPASPNVWSNGVEIVDVDGDDDYDLVFANGGSYGAGGNLAQRLYLNDGTGKFTDTSGNLNIAADNLQMVIAEDVDNDGDADLVFAPEGPYPSTTQTAKILINQGGAQLGTEGVFADESAARMPSTTMASFCVAGGDIDNDGDTDLVFTDGATFFGQVSQAKIFENDGSGNFTDVTATRAPVDLYNAQDVTLFDFDGDFDIDIAQSGKGGGGGGAGQLWLNDGTGVFIEDNAMNNVGTGSTYEVDWGDMDGDGDWDAIVQSISGLNEGAARNDGPGVPMPKLQFSGGNGHDDNEMAYIDYDNDGDLDAAVGSLGSAQEKFYNNNGVGIFTRDPNVCTATNDSTLDFGFRDLNGDGRHDMVTAQGESGVKDNNVFINNGPVDDKAPTVLNVESPAIVVPTTVFRIHIQDAIADDGKTNATADYAYETYLGGALQATGSGAAFHQGGGMYRAAVPTTVLVDGIRLTWTLADDVGNSTEETVEVGTVPGDVWADLGNGKPGTGAITPALDGVGPLTALSGNSVDLTDALAGTTTNLFVGLSNISANFKGGVLVPSPDILIAGLPVNGAGELSLGFTWPSGVPAGTNLYWQHWVVDPGATKNLAASNALESTAQ